MQWECHAHDDTGSALGSSSVDIHGDLYQNIEVGDRPADNEESIVYDREPCLLDQTVTKE